MGHSPESYQPYTRMSGICLVYTFIGTFLWLNVKIQQMITFFFFITLEE